MQNYLNLLSDILAKGAKKPAARKNMPGTISLFGYQMRHDLQTGFPLLTTKKMYWKGIIIELLWFLKGDVNIKYLIDNNVHIWDQDAYQYYLKGCKKYDINPINFEQFVNKVATGNTTDFEHLKPYEYAWGDCGYQYGKVWRDFDGIDQVAELINGLRNNPQGRRHIISAIHPAHQNDLALYWCHCMVQFNCRPNSNGGYFLDCLPFQRSADTILGVPFNIASYALLTHILAAICGMIPGELVHTFGDVHIYDNHLDATEEQLARQPTGLPTLRLDQNFKWDELKIEDLIHLTQNLFNIENYNPQPAIKAELKTGL